MPNGPQGPNDPTSEGPSGPSGPRGPSGPSEPTTPKTLKTPPKRDPPAPPGVDRETFSLGDIELSTDRQGSRQHYLNPAQSYARIVEDKTDYRTVILTDENYVTWKWHMSMVLATKNLSECITGTETNPVKLRQAATLIGSSLNDSNMQKVINCTTAQEIWSTLEAHFENKSSTERGMLLEKFTSFRITNINNMSKALSDIQAKAAKLRSLGATVDEELVISTILKALPDCLKGWRSTWKMVNASNPSLNNLISSLMAEVNEMKHPEDTAFVANGRGNFRKPTSRKPFSRGSGNKAQENAYGSRGNNGRRLTPTPGQNQVNPRTTRGGTPRPPKGSSKRNDLCNYCKKPGHWKRDCIKFKADTSDNKATALMAFVEPESVLTTEWVADSGASQHMTFHKEWMINYSLFAKPKQISLVDDHKLEGLGTGTIETSIGTMYNVMFVPNMTTNLFSITSFVKNDPEHMVLCRGDKILIASGNKTILEGSRYSGIYMLEVDVKIPKILTAMTARTTQEWHENLGHIGAKAIKEMIKNNSVRGLEVTDDPDSLNCEACAINKCKRTPHPTRSTPKVSIPGVRLHFDTAGPMPEPSLGGSRYILLCKDEASSFRMARFTENKAIIPARVKSIICKAELMTGNKVRGIVTDNGTEYINEELKHFLEERGIVHDTSVAYTPEQNGLIEREIRTVVESARTMLNDAKLPESLWCEAVNTAIYVLNRTINSKDRVRTPYELWFGRRPSLDNIRKFGQRAIVRGNQGNKDKWSEKGIQRIFVGYTDTFNTFKFYDADINQVYTSCDAVFLKDTTSKTIKESGTQDQSFSTNKVTFGDTMINELPVIVEETEGSESTLDNSRITDDGYDVPGTDDSQITEIQTTKSDKTSGGRRRDTSTCDTTFYDAVSQADTSIEDTITSESTPEPNSPEPKNPPPAPPKETERTGFRSFDVNPLNILDRRLRSHAKLAQLADMTEPKTYLEAKQRPDWKKWQEAMEEEIASLEKNKVWTLVARPRKNIVTNKWVFKIKRKPGGEVDRYKARLVARGFSQIQGIDYDETYAPVANASSIRMLFAFAAKERLDMAQFDVKTAFLYGDLEETVHMEQPEGFNTGRNQVCLLQRSLYGLKQSPRQWNKKFSQFLKDLNLSVSEHDECIFFSLKPLIIIAIYVDDGIIFAKEKQQIDKVMSYLKKQFEVHSMDTSVFLGFQVHRGINKKITLHQSDYIKTILKRFNMENAKPVDSPVSLSVVSQNNAPLRDNKLYREAIGSLMYAACTTRIDIAYAVGKLSRKVSTPTEADWIGVKRIFRYLKDKENQGLVYTPGSHTSLTVYCDADFAGDDETGRSTTGMVMILAGGPIHWKSQRQTLITLSSTEAEFVSLCSTVKDTIWLKKLGQELGIFNTQPTPIMCDNQSAIKIATNEKSIHRTRHMTVQAKYPREQVDKGIISIKHIKTDNQLADMLTKPTTVKKFVYDCGKLMSLATKVMTLIMLITVCAQSAYSYTFDRASETVWIPANNYVEVGLTAYDIDYTYINPCSVITKASRPDGKELFSNPELDQNSDQLENMREKLRKECEVTYEEHWLTKIREIRRLQKLRQKNPDVARRKRQLKDSKIMRSKRMIVGITTLIGTVVTNLAITGISHFWTGATSNRIDRAEQQQELDRTRIEGFEQVFNTTKRITDGILETIEKLANKTIKNSEDIEQLQDLLPTVAWQSADLHSKIISSSDILQEVIDKLMEGEVAIRELGQLWNTTKFNRVQSRDTILDDIRVVSESTLNFRFMIRQRSLDTRVYRIHAFKHWTNLTGTPAIKTYTGPTFLIYNRTSDCAKGIDEPYDLGVQEECKEEKSTDKRFDLWAVETISDDRTIADYDLDQTKKTPAFNYIYCYGKIIEIESLTITCPPFVFKLPFNKTYTLGMEHYEPSELKLSYKPEGQKAIDPIPSQYIHSSDTDEASMLMLIRRMRAENHEMKHIVENSIVIHQYSFSYWLTMVVIIVCTVVAVLYIGTTLRGFLRRFILSRKERAEPKSYLDLQAMPPNQINYPVYPNLVRNTRTTRSVSSFIPVSDEEAAFKEAARSNTFKRTQSCQIVPNKSEDTTAEIHYANESLV